MSFDSDIPTDREITATEARTIVQERWYYWHNQSRDAVGDIAQYVQGSYNHAFQLRKAQAELESKHDEVSALKEPLATITAHNERLIAQYADVSRYTTDKITKLKEEIRRLKLDAEERNRLQAELEKLQKVYSATQEELTFRKQSSNKAKRALANASGLHQNVDNCPDYCQELQAGVPHFHGPRERYEAEKRKADFKAALADLGTAQYIEVPEAEKPKPAMECEVVWETNNEITYERVQNVISYNKDSDGFYTFKHVADDGQIRRIRFYHNLVKRIDELPLPTEEPTKDETWQERAAKRRAGIEEQHKDCESANECIAGQGRTHVCPWHFEGDL